MSSSLKSEYKSAIQQDIAESSNSIVRRPNNVSHYQKIFQKNDGMPVFLKTKTDRVIYRNMMRFSVIGIGISAVALGMMATGKFKK